MAMIRSFRDTPPGGWRYMQPETQLRFTADHYDKLRAQVLAHREYKGLPLDTIDRDIQSQLCLSLDRHHCRPEPGEDYRPIDDKTARLTTDMVVSVNKAIGKALGMAILGQDPFVDEAESRRRAAICRRCPFNKFASACSCHAAYRAIEALIPAAKAQPGVSVCAVCACSLQAKINLSMDVVRESIAPGTVFPDWCWQAEPPAPLAPSPPA